MIILASTKTGLFGPSTWNFSLTLNAAITGMVIVIIVCCPTSFFFFGATAPISALAYLH
jgi:hypothetical protein